MAAFRCKGMEGRTPSIIRLRIKILHHQVIDNRILRKMGTAITRYLPLAGNPPHQASAVLVEDLLLRPQPPTTTLVAGYPDILNPPVMVHHMNTAHRLQVMAVLMIVVGEAAAAMDTDMDMEGLARVMGPSSI